MKILVIGSGGREHAIIWKIKKDHPESEIYCAPGNGGIAEIAECVPITVTEFAKLVEFASENKIDVTVVGMDEPLVLGIVDEFEKAGLRVFGPTKKAAQLEGSKAFSKDLMKKYAIPTAEYESFENPEAAIKYIRNQKLPLFIKADGLAAGKGAVMCSSFDEAESIIDDIMNKKIFGDSGDIVVIEQYLTGEEVSVLAFCDGKTIVPMVAAKDHKRARDNDEGLNTGGMGTISPPKNYGAIEKRCLDEVINPTLNALISEGIEFKGIIFFGLMITDDGPYVIEYNCRFGDPETQVVLPRLKSDLMSIFESCIDGTLDSQVIEWDDNACACVMAVSGGYPEKYEKGFEIRGLDELAKRQDIEVFHSGTLRKDGRIYTNGGRVIGVTGFGKNLETALDTAYTALNAVRFEKMYYRKDIGRTDK